MTHRGVPASVLLALLVACGGDDPDDFPDGSTVVDPPDADSGVLPFDAGSPSVTHVVSVRVPAGGPFGANYVVEAPFTNVGEGGDGLEPIQLLFNDELPPALVVSRVERGVTTGVAVVPVGTPSVDPASGQSTLEVVVEQLVAPSAVQGRVFRTGADDDGHGGILVAVVGRPHRTFTLEDGRFVLGGLEPGRHDLVLWAPGFLPKRLDGFMVGHSERHTLEVQVLEPSGAASGTVRGAAFRRDQSLDGFTLAAEAVAPGQPGVPLALGEDGTFDASLPPGLYELRIALVRPQVARPTCRLPHVVIDATAVTVPSCTVHARGRVILVDPLDPDGGPLELDAGTPQYEWDERWDPEVPPVASVRAPSFVVPGALVQLDASASRAGGLPSGVLLDYAWRQVAGPDIEGGFSFESGETAVRTTFRAPAQVGRLGLQLTVTDRRTGLTAAETFEVRVTTLPEIVVEPTVRQVLAGATSSFTAQVVAGDLPVVVRWSSPFGTFPGLETPFEGSAWSFTAPSVEGVYPIDVEAIVGDEVRTRTAVTVSVTQQAFAPGVLVLGDSRVATGSEVTLRAVAFGTEPLVVRWVQVSGVPVGIDGSEGDEVSFTAPREPATLRFVASATNVVGNATQAFDLEVYDASPPLRIGGDPSVDEGNGSWLALHLDYDEPLAVSTVGSGNVVLRDAFGMTVESTITYDIAARSIRVVPATPLVPGARYQLRTAGLTDRASPPNEAATEVIDFTARAPVWTRFTHAGTSSAPTSPGLAPALDQRTVHVVASRSTPACTGSQRLEPQPDGTLAPAAGDPCTPFDVSTASPDRRGHATAGSAYAVLEARHGDAPGLLATLYGDGPATFGPAYPGLFASQTQLYALTAGPAGVEFRAFFSTAWSEPGQVIADPISAGNDAFESATGTAVGTRLYAATVERFGEERRLYVRERSTQGLWSVVAGRTAQGSVAVGVDPGAPVRLVAARRDPVVATLLSTGPARGLFFSSYNSAVTPGTWATPYAIDDGGASAFDLVTRGDAAFLAYVSDGRLRLRRVDFRSTFVIPRDVEGPEGLVLNADPSCVASRPELAATLDRVWLSWDERCADGLHRVRLASLQ